MSRNWFKTALPLLLISALIAAPSCIFDPKQTEPPVDEDIVWPDLTDKEDVITTVVLCYNNASKGTEAMIQRYVAMLHTQFEFQFYPDDVDPGDSPILDYPSEILSTSWVFNNQSYLEVTVRAASWYDVDDINGDPCEGCFMTQRPYYIKAMFDVEGLQESPTEGPLMVFYVAPNESDPTKWVLRAMIDLGVGN